MKNQSTKTDIYIDLLKFGRSRMNESPFTKLQALEHLKKYGYTELSENNMTFNDFFNQAFTTNDRVYESHNSLYYLKAEAYVHLLTFESLIETRQSAQNAKTIAIVSILLTLAALIVSIIK